MTPSSSSNPSDKSAPLEALKIGLIQTRTPADPEAALLALIGPIEKAAALGARLIFTPECTNMMEQRADQKALKTRPESEDPTVVGLKALAKRLGVSLIVGSVMVRSDTEGLYDNRALVIDPHGEIIGRYNKIHLFDADTPDGKSYRESHSVKPGQQAVVIECEGVKLGLSICYDVRFSTLYRQLAKAGAQLICVNAAFTVPTGKAHWEVLLKARAIETGAFIIAAAQGGTHEDGRQTYGHSQVITPWGETLAVLDHDHEDVLVASLDLSLVSKARQALPQLKHDREFSL